MPQEYAPALLFIVFAAVMVTVLLGLTAALGPARPTEAKDEPFECGSDPVGSPRVKFSIRFYQVAILFLIFDIEAAFLYPWAGLFRELSCDGPLDSHGLCTGAPTVFGLAEMLVFVSILLVALAYVWRKRALDWT